jgi:hypothetical protein
VLILDTDMVSIVQRKAGTEYMRLVSRLAEAPPQPVYVTIVSFEEQTRGWLTAHKQKRSRSKSRRMHVSVLCWKIFIVDRSWILMNKRPRWSSGCAS